MDSFSIMIMSRPVGKGSSDIILYHFFLGVLLCFENKEAKLALLSFEFIKKEL